MDKEIEINIRHNLVELLKGGFAPVVILLREFHFDKTGIVLDGLHFSAYSLLGHMHKRQVTLLNFMKDPKANSDVWPEAHWPQNFQPESEETWNKAIADFEENLEEMISIVKNPETDLFEQHENSQTLFWAAVANLQHNGYHIGQIKAVGRQLGVW